MKKKLQRQISLVLCILISLSPFTALRALGAYGISMTSPSVTYSDEAQTVTMEVRLSESATFTLAQYTISCPSTIKLTSAKLGSVDLDVQDGLGATNQYTITYSGDSMTSDLLGTLTFNVKEGLEVGTYNITLSVGGVYNDGNPVAIDTSAVATLTIREATGEAEPVNGYTVSVETPESVTVGSTVAFPVKVEGDAFASSQMQLTFDSSLLEFSSISAGTASVSGNTITTAHFGEENQVPFTYTICFKTLAAGNAVVTLNSAAFGTTAGAETDDAATASIAQSSASVTISKMQYTVQMDDIFTGFATAVDGESYTFKPTDKEHYTYDQVTVIMGGTAVTPTKNADGSYTISSVSGNLVISGNRTANSYSVTFQTSTGVDLPADDTATYMEDYTLSLPVEDDYAISVDKVTVNGKEEAFTVSDGVLTVAGNKIVGDIVITLEQKRSTADVTISGVESGEWSAAATAKPGTDYTVTLTPDSRYTYALTAKVNGKTVSLTQVGNTYTIAGEDVALGSIEILVTKTLITDGFSVEKYVQFNGTAAWLVLYDAESQTADVYTYDGNDMFWSDKYDAYCYLVVADDSETVTASKLGLRSGEAVAVDYGMDVNKSGKVDVNDAQLAYNLYNVQYNDFTDSVTVEKALRADVNGDKTINVEDANLIVTRVLNP